MSNMSKSPSKSSLNRRTDRSSFAETKREQEERGSLDSLKLLLGKEHAYEDHTLMRFLVARQLDPAKAHTMLRNCKAWREENGIDDLSKIRIPTKSPDTPIPNNVRGYSTIPDSTYYPPLDPLVPESWKKFYHHFGGGCYHKMDREGLPLYIEQVGLLDPKGLIATCPQEVLIDFHLHNVEFLHQVLFPECSKKLGRHISKHTVIFDMKDLKAISLLKSLSEMDSLYYPETLSRLFIVNAPYIFTGAFSMVKKWLDKHTVDKIQVLGSCSDKNVIKVLRTYIDPQSLPKEYGGECICEKMVGGCVPNSKHPDIIALRETNQPPAGKILTQLPKAIPSTSLPPYENTTKRMDSKGIPEEGDEDDEDLQFYLCEQCMCCEAGIDCYTIPIDIRFFN